MWTLSYTRGRIVRIESFARQDDAERAYLDVVSDPQVTAAVLSPPAKS